MWNYPTTMNLTLDMAHGIAAGGRETMGKELYGPKSVGARGVLFPGSILLPNGSMMDYADTNGRLLIGKNLKTSLWEHHNAPWVGFDEPQCFNVEGKTSAMLQ